MDLGLLPLILAMAIVTYSWRAVPLLSPPVNRLPMVVRAYLRLVGPAMLATLAAVSVAVVVNASRTERSFHFGIEWLALALCVVVVVARRSLLIGLIGAIVMVAVARQLTVG